MKKLITVALVAALALSMVACGGTKTTSEGPAFEKELSSAGKIAVGVSPDYEPFEYYDDAGKMTGFDVEMTAELAKYLGTEATPYTIELVPMSFDTIISALNAGTIDLGISGFTYDADRDCQFSTAYIKSSQVVVVLKSDNITTVDQLAGKTIVAGLGTTGEAVAKEFAETYKGITVTSPGDYPVMFQSLKSGAVGAVVCDKAVAQSYVEANDTLTILKEEFDNEDMSVIVKNGNTELYNAVNAAIEKFVASEKYTELLAKYGIQ